MRSQDKNDEKLISYRNQTEKAFGNEKLHVIIQIITID